LNGRVALENTESNSNETLISTQICLEPNVMYEFAIYDSFGDGLCCYEGIGTYSVNVGNITIKNGGKFQKSEVFMFETFKSCVTDSECDDSDPSTIDKCLSAASTCLYFPKECSDYGQMVYIDVHTGGSWDLENLYYELNNEDNMILRGGPYYNGHTLYQSQICLVDGTYSFTMYGGEDGLLYGSYKVYTKEVNKYNIILGGSRFEYSKTTSFKLIKDSLPPSSSIIPSTHPSITKHPSFSTYPSLLPSTSLAPSVSSNPSTECSIVSVYTNLYYHFKYQTS